MVDPTAKQHVLCNAFHDRLALSVASLLQHALISLDSVNTCANAASHATLPFICSLKQNIIGSNGGIVIAEALKINTAITTIKYRHTSHLL